MSDIAGGAPLSREGVDHALTRLRDDRDRISAALLDLENHGAYQLLKGAELVGKTRLRWDETLLQITALWKLFDAYGRALDDAEQLRRRSSRPSQATLDQLTRILSGSSVEPIGEEIPLERRTLLGPATERLSFDEAVARMTRMYDQAADTIAAADSAWSALLPRLGTAEDTWQVIESLTRMLEETYDPGLERLGRELAGIGRTIRTDPLSLAGTEGRYDTGGLEDVLTRLAEARRGLEEAARLRGDFDERVRRIAESIGRIDALVGEARQVREVVLVKILAPDLPEVDDPAARLRGRLAALDGLRSRGRWGELAGRTTELESAVDTAIGRANDTLQAIGGLLDRRGELRGRLGAYAAKASRLGHAEDAVLALLYAQARDLLWTAPCDLQQATVALAKYQRAINSLVTGTGTDR